MTTSERKYVVIEGHVELKDGTQKLVTCEELIRLYGLGNHAHVKRHRLKTWQSLDQLKELERDGYTLLFPPDGEQKDE